MGVFITIIIGIFFTVAYITKVIARSTVESSIANQMTRSGYNIWKICLKPCPHCLTKARLSQKTATVAEFGCSRTFLRQCGLWTGYKTLSEYRERPCKCHVSWKTVPEGGARNRKSPFADVRQIERRYCMLVGGSRPESLPRRHHD